VQLDAALWDAFEQQLLYQIYHDKLPEGLEPGQVLQLALLADRFQVRAGYAHVPSPGAAAACELPACEDVEHSRPTVTAHPTLRRCPAAWRPATKACKAQQRPT
jgi:hypothetical protein